MSILRAAFLVLASIWLPLAVESAEIPSKNWKEIGRTVYGVVSLDRDNILIMRSVEDNSLIATLVIKVQLMKPTAQGIAIYENTTIFSCGLETGLVTNSRGLDTKGVVIFDRPLNHTLKWDKKDDSVVNLVMTLMCKDEKATKPPTTGSSQ